MARRRPDDADDFALFAAAAAPPLGRTARLLTRDHHLAEDLVQATLVAVYLRWNRVGDMASPIGYARKVLYTTFCSWRGRRWTGERPTADLPDLADPAGDTASAVGDADALGTALAALPRRQRAVVVARFFDDLSVEQTARLLGCSEGTVKTHTSRAMTALRAALGEARVP